MGKVCTKQSLRLLWKMVENTLFLNGEHIRNGGKCSPNNLLLLLGGGGGGSGS